MQTSFPKAIETSISPKLNKLCSVVPHQSYSTFHPVAPSPQPCIRYHDKFSHTKKIRIQQKVRGSTFTDFRAPVMDAREKFSLL